MTSEAIKQKLDEAAWAAMRAEYPDMIKFVADIRQQWLSLGCDLHVDCYEKLLAAGSLPEDLWGANLYPADGSIDYVSFVNIRPPVNQSMKVADPALQEKIKSVVQALVPIHG